VTQASADVDRDMVRKLNSMRVQALKTIGVKVVGHSAPSNEVN
jgi:hypothetical protein